MISILLFIALLASIVFIILEKNKNKKLKNEYDLYVDTSEQTIKNWKDKFIEIEELYNECKSHECPTIIERIDEVPVKTKERKSFFEFFKDESGHFRWRFKAKNNKIVADSGEGYTTKQNLKKGLAALSDAILSGDYIVKWKK